MSPSFSTKSSCFRYCAAITIRFRFNMSTTFATSVPSITRKLKDLRREMLETENAAAEMLRPLDAEHLQSAKNLLHYMGLRRHDIRLLQESLASLGLSSLGRCESHVLSTIDSILNLLVRLQNGHSWSAPLTAVEGFKQGRQLLETHTRSLLGAKPENRNVYIMVTMPVDAATNYELVHELLEQGMNCMRINCAHDGPDEWAGMVANLRRAMKQTGLPCRIMMDLPGPKLRTGPVESGPEIIKFRPRRDHFGMVVAPARVWLTPENDALDPRPKLIFAFLFQTEISGNSGRAIFSSSLILVGRLVL